ncbi:MAG: hypothetical protein ABIE43_05040 [Patescibacteria group bacterium]
MSKKSKILLILLVIALLLILYFFIAQESNLTKNGGKIDNTLLDLKNNYKDEVSLILADYLMLVENEDVIITEIEQAKSRLLELKVPGEFKKLHLDLVFAFTKMESYLSEGDSNVKLESQQIINQAKASYGWLRKY